MSAGVEMLGGGECIAIFTPQNQFCIAIVVILYSNFPMQRASDFNEYRIFTNTRVGVRQTGCSLTLQFRHWAIFRDLLP